MEDYKKIENVDELGSVPLETHMRYFATDKKTGEKVFRMGGKLKINKGLPTYVILTSGTANWSVQVADAIFFRKLTLDEIKTAFKDENKILNDENKKLKKELKKYKDLDKTKAKKK